MPLGQTPAGDWIRVTYTPIAEQSEYGSFTNLGVPLTKVDAYASAFAPKPGGGYTLYAGVYGVPAQLIVVDVETESVERIIPLANTIIVNVIRVAPNGDIYIGTGGHGLLYKYSPPSGELTCLGRVDGQNMVYDMQIDAAGEIFLSTYPDCGVYKFSEASGFATLLKPAAHGEKYAYRLAMDHRNGWLFVGVGSHAHLIKYNYKNNVVAGDLLPAEYKMETIANLVDFTCGKVIARCTPGFQALVIDAAAGEVEYIIPRLDWYALVPDEAAQKFYYQAGTVLHGYDLKKRQHMSLGVDIAGNMVRGAELLRLNEAGFSGICLVALLQDGRILKYHLAGGQSRISARVLPEQPVRIKSMKRGPDGNIYLATYLAKGLAVYNPLTGDMLTSKQLNQVEGMGCVGDCLYFGTYTGAGLYELDTTRPYKWGTNPRRLFDLSEYGQDRPYAVLGVENERKLFIGTVSGYGKREGAFAVYDLAGKSLTVEKNIVYHQSIISLAYIDGLVYGGSTIWNGLGSEPTEEEAKLFIWDVKAARKVGEIVPAPGQNAITCLLAGPDNRLWGFAGGWLFVYDPASRAVIYKECKFGEGSPYKGSRWYDVSLTLGKDGMIYGVINSAGQLFRLDPQTKTVTTVYSGSLDWIAQDSTGDIYFAKDEVYLYKLSLKGRY